MEKTFADKDWEIVNFHGSSPIKKAVSKDNGTSTSEIISLNQQSQVVEQQNAMVQVDERKIDQKPEYDDASLLDFMRKFAPKVEAELRKRNRHFSANFQQSATAEDDVVTKKIGVLPKHGKVEEMKSRQVCWSCYGNRIAVSFGYKKHDTWCTHSSFVLIYESDKNEEFANEAKECVAVNTCIVYMIFHPTMNSTLVFATEEGRIYWHSTTDSMESNSRNFFQSNSTKITQLSWVVLTSVLYLAVADYEGNLNLWNVSSYIKDWRVWSRFTFDRAVVCFDFSSNTEHFVVALEGGILLQCSTILSCVDDQTCNPTVGDFECSSSVIDHIAFSKFDESLFVVSSIDQILKIYHLNEKIPISSIALDSIPLGLEWSCLQDNILRVWFTNGKIRFYDYRLCCLVKCLELENSIHSLSFTLKGARLLCAVLDTHNQATIWQTGLLV